MKRPACFLIISLFLSLFIIPTVQVHSQLQGIWTSMADLPDPSLGLSLTYDNSDSLYALRVWESILKYSISLNSWAEVTDLPFSECWDGASMTYANGFLYVLRGRDPQTGDGLTEFWRYDISQNNWIRKADTPDIVWDGSALVYDGSYYIYALQGREPTVCFWRYSISSNSWVSLANSPVPFSSSDLVYAGEHIYALCGHTDKFVRYSITEHIWEFLASTPAPVGWGGALAYDGGNFIYAVRGDDTTDFWRYSISSNSWISMENTPASTGNTGASLAYAGGNIYAIRGREPIPEKPGYVTLTTDFWRYTSSGERDLTIVHVEPVQTVYGSSTYVQGKPTLIKVDISNTFSEDITTEINIEWNGQSIYEYLTIPASTISTFHLPINQFIVFTETGSQSISVEVDPNNIIAESSETNNLKSVDVMVKDTGGFSILYAFVRMPIVATMAEGSTEFIKATYPIFPDEVTYHTQMYDWMCVPCWPVLQPIDLLLDLAAVRILSGNDYSVGVIPQWCADEILPGAAGVMSPAIPGSVVVVEKYYTAAAHEIGHHYGLGFPEEYDAFPPNGKWVNGYWVTRRTPMETYCFMGTAAPSLSFERWICKEDYEHLLNELRSNAFDPELLFVSGLLFRNDTIKLRTWYRIPDGVPDLEPGAVGNYSIVCLDAQEQLISQVWFNGSFIMHTESPREFDAAGFAFTIPYPQGTAKILVTHEGEVIGQRTTSLNPPTVEVTYPNGGQVLPELATHTINWESSDPDGDELTHTVMYSNDAGATWVPLALDLTQTQYSWNTSVLPAGNSYLIRVVASDGVNTGHDDSDDLFTILSDWTHVFKDSRREMELRINIKNKNFQFIAPDKEFSVKTPTKMVVRKHKIFIWYKDAEIRLVTISVNTRRDFCFAYAIDLITRERYLLLDKPGLE